MTDVGPVFVSAYRYRGHHDKSVSDRSRSEAVYGKLRYSNFTKCLGYGCLKRLNVLWQFQ